MEFRNELVKICEQYPELKFNFHYRNWETDFLRFYQSQINYNIYKTSVSLYTFHNNVQRKEVVLFLSEESQQSKAHREDRRSKDDHRQITGRPGLHRPGR